MNIQKRIILGLTIMATAALVVGGVSLWVLRSNFENQAKVYSSGHVIFHLKKVSDAYSDVASAVKKVQGGDTWAWEEGIKKLEEAEKSLDENWNAYQSMDKTKDEKYWTSILGSQIDTSKHMMEDFHMAFVGKDLRSLTVTASNLDPTVEPIQDEIRKLEEINEKIGQEAIAQAEKGFNESFELIILVGAIVLLAGVVAGFAFSTMGIQSLNAMSMAFAGHIEQVTSQAEQVSALTGQLSGNLFESADKMQKAEKSVEKIVYAAQQNKQEANLAKHYVDEARTALSASSESLQKSANHMKNMGQGAERISQIVKTIEEIAFQTNILALNAGVEAVRAGDQGKEFVLVVEEIRNLSQRCTQVARETSKLVTDNASQTAEGVRSGEEANKALSQAFELSGKAVSLLNVIEGGVEQQAGAFREVQSVTGTAQQEAYRNSALGEKLGSVGSGLSQKVDSLRQIARQLSGLLVGGVSNRVASPANKPVAAKESQLQAQPLVEKKAEMKETKLVEKTGTDDSKVVHINK